MNLHTRPAMESDSRFLYELHKAALGPYVEATWGWDEEFQRRWFDERFDPPANEVILVDDAPVGCLRVTDRPDCVFLDYIALTPERQRQGLGTHLLRETQDRAIARGLPVRLSVLKANPARALYERLGFRVTGDDEVRWFMEFVSYSADRLGDIPIFRPLDEDTLTTLQDVVRVIAISTDEDLISEGTVGDECFVVLEGQADVLLRGNKVSVVGPGDPVGEVAVLTRRPRTATVTATTPLRVLALDGEDLRRLMRESPNFAAVMAGHLARRDSE